MIGKSTFLPLFPRFLPSTIKAPPSHCFQRTIISTPIILSFPTARCPKPLFESRFSSSVFLRCQRPHSSSKRTFSCSSNIFLLNSTEQFDNSLNNTIDQKLQAIFYFTAAWCGPCKLLYPIIIELSQKYTGVTVYKIDINQESLHNTLSRLAVNSVPTLYFYLNGQKAAQIVGANGPLLREMMEKLYGKG